MLSSREMPPNYILLVVQIVVLLLVDNSECGTCKVGHGYPVSCPRPTDPPNYTKCCKYFYQPMCCLERANNVCALGRGSKRSGGDFDPPIDWAAVFCPQPHQSDEFTACYYKNSQIDCYSWKQLAGILGGVFGGLFVIGMMILVVCCVLFKTGYCVCVKVRPGKYTCLTRRKAEMYNQRLQQLQMQQQQHHQLATFAPTQPYSGYSQANPVHNKF